MASSTSSRNFCRKVVGIVTRYYSCQRITNTLRSHKTWIYRARRPVVTRTLLAFLPVFPVVHALSFGRKKTEDTEKDQDESEVQQILEQADKLYEDNNILQLYDHLAEYRDRDNDEILWRLARATTDKGKLSEDKVKKECFYEAFEYAKRALALNENSAPAHKWYAILLDYTGEYEGTKQRISNAYIVKEHFQKAISINPQDSTSMYSLGYWCFLFADLPWYQKKLAAMLFATPPTSTYQEALEFFLQAEKVEPGFYSMNLLMIGKTYSRMKQKAEAIEYLTKARDFPVTKPDDKKAHQEALDLLKSLGVKD